MIGSLEDRLRAKVRGPWAADVGADDCWIYISRWHSTYGYGRIREGRRGSRHLLAHRVAFELYVGPLAPNEVVRHTCDLPLCCNPRHLRKGTQAENIADKLAAKTRRRFKRRNRRRDLWRDPTPADYFEDAV